MSLKQNTTNAWYTHNKIVFKRYATDDARKVKIHCDLIAKLHLMGKSI